MRPLLAVMLTPGSRLGPYEIESALGAGGMGEVYRAHDTKLGRDVAIKILPADISHDADCRVRFEREARLLAALNNPHIATIYAVQETAATSEGKGGCAIVMEVVEGPTLAERLAKGPLSLVEALEVASQIVDALEAAHGKGIVHRDLKPANIKVTPGGVAKVLDFGLATAMRDSVLAEREQTQQLLSRTGDIRGTPAYMSPEQTRGQTVDRRADIWAFGCVLYQMLTGRAAFAGDTVADIMAATLDREPDWSALPAATPISVRRLLRRTLEKDVERRLSDVREARGDLQRTPRQALQWTARIAAAVVLVTAAVALLIYARRFVTIAPTVPVPLSLSFSQMTATPGGEWFPSLSPDGKWIAYAADGNGNRDIFLQSSTGQTPINLTADSPDDDDQPAFSPDGDRIAFMSRRDGGGIFIMGRTGESLRRITREGFNPSWSPDGAELLYTTENVQLDPQNTVGVSQLWAVDVASGARRRIDVPDAVLPAWSPHAVRIAYTSRREIGGSRKLDVWTADRDGRDTRAVTMDGAFNWNPVWSPDGKHLYFASARGGATNLWRVAIDERSGQTLGVPEALTVPAPFVAHLTISKDGGLLAYSSVLRTRNIQRVALDPATGAMKGEPAWVTTGSRTWSNPDPSPDGKLVAFYSNPQPEHLYVARPGGSLLRQITSGASYTDRVPRWSPDGQWIAFFSNRTGGYHVWKVRPDGSDLQELTDVSDASFPAWSPDGTQMAVTMTAGPGHPDASYVFNPHQRWKDQTPHLLPPAQDARPFVVNSWSPDGRTLAGQDGLAANGILTYSLHDRTYTRLTSSGGYPAWMPDSRRLIFVVGGKDFVLLDTATRRTRKIFSVERDVIGPAQLSRDGREMYFSRRVTEADIWLLKMNAK